MTMSTWGNSKDRPLLDLVAVKFRPGDFGVFYGGERLLLLSDYNY